MLGKTNTPTFGWVGVTDNLLFGPTRNPWNPNVTPGGSSGGAGAAAAAGLGPLHVGTDGGGSIRKPAAWCGIYGFKPSYGRVGLHPPRCGVESVARRPDDAHGEGRGAHAVGDRRTRRARPVLAARRGRRATCARWAAASRACAWPTARRSASPRWWIRRSRPRRLRGRPPAAGVGLPCRDASSRAGRRPTSAGAIRSSAASRRVSCRTSIARPRSIPACWRSSRR